MTSLVVHQKMGNREPDLIETSVPPYWGREQLLVQEREKALKLAQKLISCVRINLSHYERADKCCFSKCVYNDPPELQSNIRWV